MKNQRYYLSSIHLYQITVFFNNHAAFNFFFLSELSSTFKLSLYKQGQIWVLLELRWSEHLMIVKKINNKNHDSNFAFVIYMFFFIYMFLLLFHFF